MRCDTTLQRTLRKRAAAGRFSKQAGRCIAVMASMFMAFLIPLTVLSGCAAASQDDASVRVFYLNAENNALVPNFWIISQRFPPMSFSTLPSAGLRKEIFQLRKIRSLWSFPESTGNSTVSGKNLPVQPLSTPCVNWRTFAALPFV